MPILTHGYFSHSTLKLTKVNTYGLLYELEGSDSTLKPLLLCAHQGMHFNKDSLFLYSFVYFPDVVPVDPKTVDQWEQPPYSGYFDGL